MLLLAIPMVTRAQYDVVFSHYADMQSSFNPAAIGKDPKLNINASYALQMAGYTHNPNTAYISADMPINGLGGKNGLGAVFLNDKIGLFSHQRIAGQYAYHHKLGKKGSIGIGVQAGLLSETFRGSDVDIEDTSDPVFSSTELEGQALDVAAGLYVKFPSWYVGVSAQHLTYPVVELGDYNEIAIDGTFYVTGGYEMQLPNPTLKLSTAALVRSDLVTYRGDISARMIYTHEEKMMYLGLGYSPTNSVTLYVGGNVKGFILGYSYEAYTNGVGIANGSHELRIGFQTDINLGKKGRNYHQSVRYL